MNSINKGEDKMINRDDCISILNATKKMSERGVLESVKSVEENLKIIDSTLSKNEKSDGKHYLVAAKNILVKLLAKLNNGVAEKERNKNEQMKKEKIKSEKVAANKAYLEKRHAKVVEK